MGSPIAHDQTGYWLGKENKVKFVSGRSGSPWGDAQTTTSHWSHSSWSAFRQEPHDTCRGVESVVGFDVLSCQVDINHGSLNPLMTENHL